MSKPSLAYCTVQDTVRTLFPSDRELHLVDPVEQIYVYSA